MSSLEKRNMSKKPNLANALHGASGKARPMTTEVAAAVVSPKVTSHAAASVIPPSRQGKKALTGFFDPGVVKEIKQLALNNDCTIQALLAEALNDLLVKHGRNPIAS